MALSFGKQASSRNDFTVPTLMQGEHDELARTSAINFARQLADRWQQLLGSDLLGLYLIGSLAHAGFSKRFSDIDIALITSMGLTPQALDHLRGEAVALSADWGTKVSVFWAHRHFSLVSRPCDCADRARTTAASATHARRNTDLLAWRTIFDLGRPGANLRGSSGTRAEGPQGVFADSAVPRSVLLQLDHRPYGLKRRRRGVPC